MLSDKPVTVSAHSQPICLIIRAFPDLQVVLHWEFKFGVNNIKTVGHISYLCKYWNIERPPLKLLSYFFINLFCRLQWRGGIVECQRSWENVSFPLDLWWLVVIKSIIYWSHFLSSSTSSNILGVKRVFSCTSFERSKTCAEPTENQTARHVNIHRCFSQLLCIRVWTLHIMRW